MVKPSSLPTIVSSTVRATPSNKMLKTSAALSFVATMVSIPIATSEVRSFVASRVKSKSPVVITLLELPSAAAFVISATVPIVISSPSSAVA
jgi:hypothetical protein